jgi:hypothetical protein
MTIVKVAVIKKSEKTFLVRPSVVFLKDGDELRVLNTTSHVVTITPPRTPAKLACPPPPPVNPLAILGLSSAVKLDPCGQWSPKTPVRSSGAQNVFCRYHVVVNGQTAAGDSDPVIIIDNP